MNRYPMTVEGERLLRSELERLKKEKPLVSEAIATAREHGDLRENAEYHAAREQMGFLEGRIKDIEARLSNAQVIDITSIPPGDKVIFGVTVTLINTGTDQKVTYRIVGEDEADVNTGKISIAIDGELLFDLSENALQEKLEQGLATYVNQETHLRRRRQETSVEAG